MTPRDDNAVRGFVIGLAIEAAAAAVLVGLVVAVVCLVGAPS